MKVLIVGGTGLIGGTIGLHLEAEGHDVTLMARSATASPALKHLPFMACDYINDPIDDGRLRGFDALVFSAAADIRNVPQDGSATPGEVYKKANDEAVPRFFAAARAAGIKSAVYIGTFYPTVAPQQIGVCDYVTSRHHTDQAVLAMSSDDFRVCSLGCPFVLGYLPGLPVPHLEALAEFARGNLPLPHFAPPGGTNHITTDSVAQATLAALEHGEGGKHYLVGDMNYSWKEYFELWFAAVGNPADLPVQDDEHPLLPNIILFAGPGATVSYEPDASEVATLGHYGRDKVKDMVQHIVSQLGSTAS